MKKENDFGINDIFILNQYKGKGIGKQAVENLLEEKRGQYFVIELLKMYQQCRFGRKYIKTEHRI